MRFLKKAVCIFAIALTLISCNKINDENIQKINRANENKPVTVFVHGTIPPHFKWFIFGFDCPHGLTPCHLFDRKLIHTAIGHTLHDANSNMFPSDSFYLYGWKSRLNFLKRYKEAQKLYQDLKVFKGPITLIGHSHGGNVILNLARIARELGEENNCPLNIERIILMAVPVQEDTKDYVKSKIFNKIYALYSTGDRTQIKDPQRFHKYMRDNYSDRYLPCSSGRLFEETHNMKQIRMLLHGRNVQHLDFIFTDFMSRLPETLSLMDRINLRDPKIEYIIDIPRGSGCPILKQKIRQK